MTKIPKDDNNYIYYWVGKNIKKYRKQKCITQRQLADMGNYSENFIGDLENEGNPENSRFPVKPASGSARFSPYMLPKPIRTNSCAVSLFDWI